MTREYSAFLLRLWRNHSDQAWRASLHHAQTGECKHFADISQLVAYLEQYDANANDLPADIVEWVLSN
jgi:hypothetical protein